MRGSPVIFVVAVLLAACGNTKLTHTLPPNVRVDAYDQQSASAVDVLWVVDNSGSMAPYQATVGHNFDSFINIFTRGAIDYRIAVTTTDVFHDQGNFLGTPSIITPQTPDVINAFLHNIQVGVNGSPYETGLEAARLAVVRQTQANAPSLAQISACQAACMGVATCIQGCPGLFPTAFLRPGAYLYIIFVGDDDDNSTQDLRYYYRSLADAKGSGNDGTVLTAAITGTAAVTPCGATLGARYIELSQLTNGDYGSICDASFAGTLHNLANNAVGLKRKFALTALPNVQTLSVSINYPCSVTSDVTAPCVATDNSACTSAAPDARNLVCTPQQGGTDGWSYEADTNVIYFAGNSVPDLHAQVEIEYYQQGTQP